MPLSSEQGAGSFRYIHLLLQELGKYNLNGHRFIIYKQKCISRDYLSIPSNLDCEFIDTPNVGRGLRRIFFEQTLFYLYIKKCDVFYSYCSSMPVFVKAKKVFTLHDVYFLTEKERYGILQRTYLKFVTLLYIKISQKILTVSMYSKNEILRHYKINPEKISITYNFIIQEDKGSTTSGLLFDYRNKKVDLKKPFFLYIGNIHPGKNIIRMAEAFNMFNHNKQQYQLLICGKPANQGKGIIERLDKINDVVYLGYQPRESIVYLLQHCVSVVLVSLCEGFGIPPLEGISNYKPALVSKGTSLPEVIGAAGVCVNPHDLEDISKGYSEIVSNYDSYVIHCDEQLSKFSSKESVETFMKEIGIKSIQKN